MCSETNTLGVKILAFETSCDDTSVAIFEGTELLFMDTASQIKIHNITGGVVPEVAAREHANAIFEVLENVLVWAWVSLEEIDYIAVTKTPGLMPSLLTWLTVARTLWNILKKEVLEINHIEAHIFANFMERKSEDIEFPLVCLTVSGWHNEIYYMENMFDMQKLGWTTDDSAWEAFDKVAKMMGLGYPGWPIVSKLAWEYEAPSVLSDISLQEGDKEKVPHHGGRVRGNSDLFPRVWLKKDEYDFSFSGLKSAVKREVDKRKSSPQPSPLGGEGVLDDLSIDDKREISFEFESAVTEVLAYKLVNAWIKKRVWTVMLAGWVSANDKLISLIEKKAEKEWLNFIHPVKKVYCWDNAAMVWINAYYKIKNFW